ncbi:uncharacterized protein A4U43_C03F2360 [Asparagus officinalis]|uniref:Uncharacterized protein n=1 Tax=Asparagus officinalis TaxID=4686 RepID=A0A5P1FB63_ASPOF|nr:uncharacterized protein A4U43_C03F2360 [Asparagus officinalis]
MVRSSWRKKQEQRWEGRGQGTSAAQPRGCGNLAQAGYVAHSPGVVHVDNNVSVAARQTSLKGSELEKKIPDSKLVHVGHVLNPRAETGHVNVGNNVSVASGVN